ncbi:MAG: hypothetical protein IBJ18_12275 [Phycisphaerales bacterium]|nr:hypothetical protein [Phycisphaerales bacterium]
MNMHTTKTNRLSKTLSPFALVLAAATLLPVSGVMAEPEKPQPPAGAAPEGGKRPGRDRRPEGGQREGRPMGENEKKYDANNDGKLDESERSKMQEEMKAHATKMKTAIDTNGDGKLSSDEWKAVSVEIAARRDELAKRLENFTARQGGGEGKPEGEAPQRRRPNGGGGQGGGQGGGPGGPDGERRGPGGPGGPGGEGGGRGLDANGDGKLDDTEKQAAFTRFDEMNLRLLASFDADNNNVLSADEKAKMEQAVKERRDAGPGGERRRPEGGAEGRQGRRPGGPNGGGEGGPGKGRPNPPEKK